MKALITGAGGFIGSNLVGLLLEKGFEVWGLDNFLTGNERNLQDFKANPAFHFSKGSVIDFDFSPIPAVDIIFHLASPASPIQYKKYAIETLMTNAYGTQHVLDFMKSSGSKSFVMASTSEVYGDPEVHPQKEEYWGRVNPVGERSVYDEAKRFAESLIMAYRRSYDLDVRIARIFNTYGPNMERNDGRVVSNFICQALGGGPLTVYGDGSQTRSFCYVSDLIEGLLLLGTTPNLKGEIINLGNPDERTILEIANLIKKMTETSSEIVFEPIGPDDPTRRCPDITKAKSKLGWEPKVPLEEGLKKTREYFSTRYFTQKT